MKSSTPTTCEGAIELFTHHNHYTKPSVDAFIEKKSATGDCNLCAQTALKECAEWFCNSLNELLKTFICHSATAKTVGPSLWMIIAITFQAQSLTHWWNLATQFNALPLAKPKSESIDCCPVDTTPALTQLKRKNNNCTSSSSIPAPAPGATPSQTIVTWNTNTNTE